MRFTKMQGIGNDYVYVNCFEEHVENPSELAKQMSRRHYGVGSDGLILICPSDVADFEMKMYNADGSNGGMCGNGARCLCRHCHDRGLAAGPVQRIETPAGAEWVFTFRAHDAAKFGIAGVTADTYLRGVIDHQRFVAMIPVTFVA